MNLIDGKVTAAAIKEEIAEEVKTAVKTGARPPHLVAVLVGHDGGSETYVKNKVIACEKCGFKSTLLRYEDNVSEEELLDCVSRLNRDESVDGFIVQLPLPHHIDEQKIIEAIDYRKDVDGFHPVNVGARTQQHRRQANGSTDDAKTIWRCNSYRVPLSHKRHRKRMSRS